MNSSSNDKNREQDIFEPVASLDLGQVVSTTLRPSDRGLEFILNFESSRSVRVAMDWPRVAELSLRMDKFGNEALTMMQIGLGPYHSPHRESFSMAGLLACTSPAGGDE